jgi:hypothetical protein
MMKTCRKCHYPIEHNGQAWVVVSDDSGNGLSYCPPNPDAAKVGKHVPAKAEK